MSLLLVVLIIPFIITACGEDDMAIAVPESMGIGGSPADDSSSQWKQANQELIAQVQQASAKLPVRDYPELMMKGIPDLSEPAGIAAWNAYMALNYQYMGVKDVRQEAAPALQRGHINRSERLAALVKIVDDVAGFVKVSSDGYSIRLLFDFPAQSLYLENKGAVESDAL